MANVCSLPREQCRGIAKQLLDEHVIPILITANYFITQTDEEPLKMDSTAFLASFYPTFNDYHNLYEVDNYAWFEGGRNLFDPEAIMVGKQRH